MSVTLFSFIWILVLIASLGLLFHINVNLKKKFKFSTRILISTIIGLIIGIIFRSTLGVVGVENIEKAVSNVTSAASLVGKGFTSLLRMLVVPLVGISIYNSIVNSKNTDNIKKLSIISVAYYTGTVAIASIIGMVVSLSFGLGKNMSIPADLEKWTGKGEYKGIVDVILSFIPTNIFKAASENNIIGVVIFAAFLGFATNRVAIKHPETVKPLKDLTKSVFAIITSVIITIIKIIPFGVAALMFNLAASYGLEVFKDLVTYFIVMIIAMGLTLVMQSILLIVNGINPFKYYKKAVAPLILAFTSTSSMGTLPVTVETLENEIGVSTTTANFTAPLGTTIGMNACAGVFPTVVAIMIANINNVPITPIFLLNLLIIVILGSFGMAGLPGTAYIAATVVLGGLGLPFDAVAIIFPVDTIVDMGRTMTNVNGAMTITVITDKKMGTFESKL